MSIWRKARLGECCEIVGGSTPSTSIDAYWDGDIYWATPKDMSNLSSTFISDTSRKLTRAGLESCAASILPSGSVLFSSRAPIGHVAVNTVPMATNQGFKSFVPKLEIVHAKFLYWWLRTNRSYLEGLGNGATFKEVSKAIVSRIEIPLPPLHEQRRIAEVLDRAEALRAKRRTAIALLDELTQSIFSNIFGDPVRNEKEWPRKNLGEVTAKITDGEHLNPIFSETGMPMVMAGNVLEGHIDIDSSKRVEINLGERFQKKCNPQIGDLLVVSRGATIGRMCLVNTSHPFCLMGSVILLKLRKDMIDPSFLTTFLKHPVTRGNLYKTSGSSAQQAIYLKDVKNLVCPVPPLIIQHEFARRIAAVEKLKAAHRASLTELDKLFASLQHRAFRGEL